MHRLITGGMGGWWHAFLRPERSRCRDDRQKTIRVKGTVTAVAGKRKAVNMYRHKGSIVQTLSALALACTTQFTHAAVIPDSMGDITPDPIYLSNDGASKSLTSKLNGASPIITQPNGDPLIVGDTTLGQNPAASNQLQFQRFLATTDSDFRLHYLGGEAYWKSILAVYSYPVGANPQTATLSITSLVNQKTTAAGAEAFFSIPANHYFGFMLDANGANTSEGRYYSENFRNTDNIGALETDHFQMFDTNRGLLLAVEDTAYNSGTGRLGDQDYNDVLFGLLTYGDGTNLETPEPTTSAMLVVGGAILLMRRKRRTVRDA